LLETLRELVAAGKRGKKNRDGFLLGTPLPWAPGSPSRETAGELARDFRALAVNTCARAAASGDIDAAGLNLAFSSLFAGASTLDEERRRSLDSGGAERLARLHQTTGRSYFLPGSRSRATVALP
jgi:hypothetical protein